MLPASLPAALQALEREPLFRAQLGEVFIDYYLKLKGNEAGRFAQWLKDGGIREGDDPTAWEQNEYFDFF
jgi:glutamine synthetase